MGTLVTCRQIASRGGYRPPLRTSRSAQLDDCSDGVSIALVPYQFEAKPVILCWRHIAEHISGSIIGGDDEVLETVVVQVADGEAATGPCLLEDVAGFSRDILKFASSYVSHKKHRLLV